MFKGMELRVTLELTLEEWGQLLNLFIARTVTLETRLESDTLSPYLVKEYRGQLEVIQSLRAKVRQGNTFWADVITGEEVI